MTNGKVVREEGTYNIISPDTPYYLGMLPVKYWVDIRKTQKIIDDRYNTMRHVVERLPKLQIFFGKEDKPEIMVNLVTVMVSTVWFGSNEARWSQLNKYFELIDDHRITMASLIGREVAYKATKSGRLQFHPEIVRVIKTDIHPTFYVEDKRVTPGSLTKHLLNKLIQ